MDRKVLCVFRLYGPKRYIEKMKEFMDVLIADGLLYIARCSHR